MGEFRTPNPQLYVDLGLEYLLADTPKDPASGEPSELGDYGNRVTDSDIILSIRRDEATGEFEVVPIDVNGAKEIISGVQKARQAYFHPSVTPGLDRVHKGSPWDQALDALNDLGPEDRAWALQDVGEMGRNGFAAPTTLLDAVRRQRHDKELDQAA